MFEVCCDFEKTKMTLFQSALSDTLPDLFPHWFRLKYHPVITTPCLLINSQTVGITARGNLKRQKIQNDDDDNDCCFNCCRRHNGRLKQKCQGASGRPSNADKFILLMTCGSSSSSSSRRMGTSNSSERRSRCIGHEHTQS